MLPASAVSMQPVRYRIKGPQLPRASAGGMQSSCCHANSVAIQQCSSCDSPLQYESIKKNIFPYFQILEYKDGFCSTPPCPPWPW